MNMRKSLVPVTFDEQTGVNLEIGNRVIFKPGQNIWGLFPEGEYVGVYAGWASPQPGDVQIKVEFDYGKRVHPPIENVWRIWDVRDDEIAALHKLLDTVRVQVLGEGNAALLEYQKQWMTVERNAYLQGLLSSDNGQLSTWHNEDLMKRLGQTPPQPPAFFKESGDGDE